MINNVNNLSFKANIKVGTRIRNKSDFETVVSEFRKKTAKFPDDTLYITKSLNNVSSWHINNQKRGDFFDGIELFTNNINEQLKELGPKKLARKLVNAFKAFKLEENTHIRKKEIKQEIEKYSNLVMAYRNMSNAYKNDGKKIMASRYEILATRNEERLEELNKEYTKLTNYFDTNIEKLSREFPEIGQIA